MYPCLFKKALSLRMLDILETAKNKENFDKHLKKNHKKYQKHNTFLHLGKK